MSRPPLLEGWRSSSSTNWRSTTSTESPETHGLRWVGVRSSASTSGTSAVKGLAVDPDFGLVLASAECGYPVTSPHVGGRQRPDELWLEATQNVLDSLETGVSEVLAIGFSGQMHGLVCIDEFGDVIRPAILWNDQRSAPQCEGLEAGGGRDRLVRLTGNRALPGFTAPKLLWMREHEPAAYARIQRICLPEGLRA